MSKTKLLALIRVRSVVLEVVEAPRLLQVLYKLAAVFDVRVVVVNLGIEDVAEGHLSQEVVADLPHASCVSVPGPDCPEAGYCREGGLELGEIL